MDEKMMIEEAANSLNALNPFKHRIKLTIVDKIKVVVMTATILPIRLISMVLVMSIVWILMKITLIGISDSELQSKPIMGWRRKYMQPPARFLARLASVLCGWHWTTYTGKRATFKEAPILVVAPHSSFFDTVPCIKLGCPGMVVKDTIKKAPIFGSVIRFAQPIFVTRSDASSRHKTVQEIIRRSTCGDKWKQVLIFPEGTCTNRSCLISFKLGAFYPGLPVQPVLIRYPNSLDTITWTWDGPGALKQMWLTFCQFHIFCRIEFLPTYTPSEAEKNDPKLFADNVRCVMAKALNIPVSNFTLDDIRYLTLTTTHSLPRTTGLVKIMKIRFKLGYKSDVTMTEIANFADRCKKIDPMCTLKEFSEHLKDEGSEALREFFDVVDQGKKGKIDIRIYTAGLWLLKADISELERLKNAFNIFGSLVSSHSFEAIYFLWFGLSSKQAYGVYKRLKYSKGECFAFDDVKFYFVDKIRNGMTFNDNTQNGKISKCSDYIVTSCVDKSKLA